MKLLKHATEKTSEISHKQDEDEIRKLLTNLAHDIYGHKGIEKPYCCGYRDLLNTANELDFNPFDKENILYAGLTYMYRDFIDDHYTKLSSKEKDWLCDSLDYHITEPIQSFNESQFSKYKEKVKRDLEFISNYFGGGYFGKNGGGRFSYKSDLIKLIFDKKYVDFNEKRFEKYENLNKNRFKNDF